MKIAILISPLEANLNYYIKFDRFIQVNMYIYIK